MKGKRMDGREDMERWEQVCKGGLHLTEAVSRGWALDEEMFMDGEIECVCFSF